MDPVLIILAGFFIQVVILLRYLFKVIVVLLDGHKLFIKTLLTLRGGLCFLMILVLLVIQITILSMLCLMLVEVGHLIWNFMSQQLVSSEQMARSKVAVLMWQNGHHQSTLIV